MENPFDAFSKSLAESVSRRDSLRRLGAVFAGAALSALGLAAARGAHNQDECLDDEDCPQGLSCCSGVCTNLDLDDANCGACGHVCDSPTPYCNGGECSPCHSPLTYCGVCVDLNNDNNNCGACFVFCGDGFVCSGGTCVPIDP